VPEHIVLVGLMGSGKSAVARRLAGDGIAVLDTDRLVEMSAGSTVREIFDGQGEEAFRRLEEEAVRSCMSHPGRAVIAAAGGVVTRTENRRVLNEARERGDAWVVWLHTDPDELARRVTKGTHRPLLDDDPAGTLARLGSERAPMYAEVADLTVDTTRKRLDEVAAEILDEFAARFGDWGATNG
jgi:shikimate kinase